MMANQWTPEVAGNAMAWLNKAALDYEQWKGLHALRDHPDALRQACKEVLSQDQWRALLNALRQKRYRKGKGDECARLMRECEELRRERDMLRARLRERGQSLRDVSPEMARLLRMLCHPDKHNGSKASEKAFAWLQKALDF